MVEEAESKTPLEKILDNFRKASVTEREKGTYFEELIICVSEKRGLLQGPVQRRHDLCPMGRTDGILTARTPVST